MTLAIQTNDHWDANADGYIASAKPFTAQFCEDAADLATIERGMDVLDVATGPGAFALAAATRGARVTAVDFSATMIARLRARIGDLPITACQMDGQSLAVRCRPFDDHAQPRTCGAWRYGQSRRDRRYHRGGAFPEQRRSSAPAGHRPHRYGSSDVRRFLPAPAVLLSMLPLAGQAQEAGSPRDA